MTELSLVSEETVVTELRKALAQTLRIPEETIRPESSIARDLGADSLDFLDVNYRVEQAFGIKMPRQHLLETVEEMFGEGTALDDEGRLTGKALRLLQLRYPDVDLSSLETGMGMEEVAGLITVRSMAGLILDILGSLPEHCGCGAAAWQSEDGRLLRCGACGAGASTVNGDELNRRWLRKVVEETGVLAGDQG